jgi:hypothetical protein
MKIGVSDKKINLSQTEIEEPKSSRSIKFNFKNNDIFFYADTDKKRSQKNRTVIIVKANEPIDG